jgi:hypothetical protein
MSILLSNICNLCTSAKKRETKFHTHTKQRKNVILHILILKVSENVGGRQEFCKTIKFHKVQIVFFSCFHHALRLCLSLSDT